MTENHKRVFDGTSLLLSKVFDLVGHQSVRATLTRAHPQMANLPDIGVARKI
jgi:hypothetical protein